jgi:predicted histidine transporter YuiF (NhaC family)
VLPIPVRIVLTAIYNGSDRSLPIVGLYHAGLGVATGTAFIPVLAPGIAPIVVYAGFAVLAVIVLVATRGRLGFTGSAEPRPTTVAAMA